MIGRVMQVGLVVLMLAGPLASVGMVVAQGGGAWTCDGSENDALNAAQAAYDAGDYARAEELATLAVDLCQRDVQRWPQALDLKTRAAALAIPDTCMATITLDDDVSVDDIISADITDAVWMRTYCIEARANDVMMISWTSPIGDLVPLVLLMPADMSKTLLSSADQPPSDSLSTMLYSVTESATYIIAVTREGLEAGTTTGTLSLLVTLIEDPTSAALPSSSPSDLQDLYGLGNRRYAAGDYAGAAEAYQQALVLAQSSGLRETEGELLNAIGACLFSIGQAEAALPYYTASVEIMREVGGVDTEVLALENLALANWQLLRYDEAIAAYEAALALYREQGDVVQEATTLLRLGQVYNNMADYEAALAHYQMVLDLVREAGDTGSEATIINLIGLVYYNLERFEDAEAAYQEALTAARQYNDQAGEAGALNNLGLFLYNTGRYAEALAYFEPALALAQELGYVADAGTMISNIGLVYMSQGRTTEAVAQFQQAMDIAQDTVGMDTATILSNLAFAYTVQGRYGEALLAYEEALGVAQRQGNLGGEATIRLNRAGLYLVQSRYAEALVDLETTLVLAEQLGSDFYAANTLMSIATIYANQQRLDDALTAYEQALAIFRGLGISVNEAQALLNIGSVYGLQGDIEVARPYYEEALSIYQAADAAVGEAQVQIVLGGLLLMNGEYAASLPYLEAALSTYQASNNTAMVASLLANLGYAYELLEQRPQAIDTYRQAASQFRQVVNQAGSDEAVTALTNTYDAGTMTSRLVRLLVLDGQPAAALDVVEQNRALLSRTELSSDAIDFRTGLSDQTLLEQETALRVVVGDAQAYLDALRRDAGASAADIQAADTALTTARRAYDQHLERMQLDGGFLARQVATQGAALARIQKALPADTTLVVYSAGDVDQRGIIAETPVVAFIITRTGFEAVSLAISGSAISDQLATFNADRLNNTAALATLYDALIAPLADHLTTSRLMISPDGPLNYVPFAALQAPDGSYLIDQYAISMIASGTTLVLLNDRAAQSTPNPTTPALVMAQPSAAGLSRLQNARREALEVGTLLGVEANINATEADLRADVAGAGVLHISAHATLDPFAPLYSVIHLGEGGGYDGRLEVREIYELDLSQTTLVILSGCETGSGGDGENFGLLNRAFLGAGASQVVASLWSVDDAATATLITTFVAAWQTHDNAADALQAAMRATREQYPDPYYWAALTLNGLPQSAR